MQTVDRNNIMDIYKQARNNFECCVNDSTDYKRRIAQAFVGFVYLAHLKVATGQLALPNQLVAFTCILEVVPCLDGPAEKQDVCCVLEWFG
eukprot:4722431-Alexandrium_andersonii.AAC.1